MKISIIFFLLPLVNGKRYVVMKRHNVPTTLYYIPPCPVVDHSNNMFVVDCQDDIVLTSTAEMIIEEDSIYHTTIGSWGLDRIDQESLPLDGNPFPSHLDGTDIDVYMIDTGVLATHVEFQGRVQYGGDFINEGRPWDMNGHGTHTAGIAAGSDHGVARGARIWAVKVLSKTGSGTMSGVIKGIEWSVANATKSSVLSLSLGGGYSEALNAAVKAASDAGHIVVVAAGNNYQSDACLLSPASAGGKGDVITVMSSDVSDSLSSFSNNGLCTDIIAPGSSILSSYSTSDTSYATLSGTSMATPFVAGVAALLLQKYDGNHSLARDELFASAIINKITGNLADGPNLLLQTPTYTGPPTPPTLPPTNHPTPSPPKICFGGICTEYFRYSTFGPVWDVEQGADVTWLGYDETLCNNSPEDINNTVVVVGRGDCPFLQKVVVAQDAGAVGVAFINHITGSLFEPTTDVTDTSTIPSLLVEYNFEKYVNKSNLVFGYTGDLYTPTIPPTKFPTRYPTRNPTMFPTKRPTKSPTSFPTRRPTTERPTKSPTLFPTRRPTKSPTMFPTRRPTTERPSKAPTMFPTRRPTNSPTLFPTR